MLTIILKWIFYFALGVLSLFLFYVGIYDRDKKEFRFSRKFFLGFIPIMLILLLKCIAVIPANTVGVLYSPFSGTSETTLQEGFNLKMPFDTIYVIDTTIKERTDKEVAVQTKDAQWVKMDINVKYQVEKTNAFKVYKGYKTLENLHENIIGNYTQTALNKICTQYNIIDILGEKRNEILDKTIVELSESLKNEGVTLKALTIKDVDAGEEIEKAIKAEAVAKKAVETAKQNQERAKTEAETKLIQAEGEAKANAVKTKALTDKVLLEQWIQKWDGKLPTVSGSDNNMIDISQLLEGAKTKKE